MAMEGIGSPSYEMLYESDKSVRKLLIPERQKKYSFFMQSYYMDDHLFAYLNGKDILPQSIQGYAELKLPDQEVEQLYGMDLFIEEARKEMEKEQCFYVEGPHVSGKKSVVIHAARNIKRTLLVIELAKMNMKELKERVFDIQRELYLYKAYLCIHGLSEDWLKKQDYTKKRFLAFCMETFADKGFLFCICAEAELFIMQDWQHFRKRISLRTPEREKRILLWNFFAEKYRLILSAEQAGNRYRMEAGEIKMACEMLRNRKKEGELISESEIGQVCRELLPVKAVKGQIIDASDSMTFEDLKLDAEEKEQLMDIYHQVCFSHQVFDVWNMESKFPYGKAVSALFYGPPGTGKTMAAHILAKELGYPLYKVDLSQILDKYIGETEKHLEQIFDQAQKSNTVLFFDEADAIFGKRSEVKDANDRYANTQVSYILQRIEAYDGIVILATNFKENIDRAFLRRIKYVIHFTMSTEQVRKEIWESCFPKEVPVKEIDYSYLARNFELSGGNIKNVVLSAVFYAASTQKPVGMKHIIRALKQEYQKMGHFLTERELGEYSYLI